MEILAKLKTIKGITGLFFWAGVFCELIVSFSGYLFGGYREKLIIFAGMGFFSISVALSLLDELLSLKTAEAEEKAKGRKRLLLELIICILAGGYGLICFKAQGSALIIRIFLALMAGRNQKPEPVIRVFFFGTAIGMLVGALLAAAGLHNSLWLEDLYRHEEERRYTFGFFHPNGFSLFAFRLLLMGIYLYGEKAKAYILYPIAVVGMVPVAMANSKTAILGCVAILLLSIYVKYRKKERSSVSLYIAGIGFMILLAGLMLSLRFYPYPALNYGQELTYWDKWNEISSGRLEHGRIALLEQPYSLFGASKDVVTDGTEIGYINSFLFEGSLFILLYVILAIVSYTRLRKKGDVFAMLVFMGVIYYSLAEAFLPYFNKNLIWLLMLGWLCPTEKPEPLTERSN